MDMEKGQRDKGSGRGRAKRHDRAREGPVQELRRHDEPVAVGIVDDERAAQSDYRQVVAPVVELAETGVAATLPLNKAWAARCRSVVRVDFLAETFLREWENGAAGPPTVAVGRSSDQW
jgi:hypothetical protein